VFFSENDCTVVFFIFDMVRNVTTRRNLSIRLRHNALSFLERYRVKRYRKFCRFLLVASSNLNFPDRFRRISKCFSLWYLLKARRIENKQWVNPLSLKCRRKTMISNGHPEVCYQELRFEKDHLYLLLLV